MLAMSVCVQVTFQSVPLYQHFIFPDLVKRLQQSLSLVDIQS